MKKMLFLVIVTIINFSVQAQHLHNEQELNKNITPYNDAVEAVNGINAVHLNQEPEWRAFVKKYPTWSARFNRYTRLPHRAFGQAIVYAPGGNDPIAKAKAFMQQELSVYNIPIADLVLTRNFNDGKFIHVDFKQIHNGVEVLWSRVGIRFTQDLRIVLFMLDAHKDIPVLQSNISGASAIQAAEQAISTTIIQSELGSSLKIFPYPVNGRFEYKLVYEVIVNTQDDKETPGKYQTYVDAISGKILYRQNQVLHIDFKVKADAYPTNLYGPIENLPLKNLNVNVGGTNYFTDLSGNVTVPGTGTVNPTITLSGKFIKIVTGASGTTSATYSTTGVANGDSVNFLHASPDATERHMTCYYHANHIHDFMKTKLPGFTAMDNPLTTRVDRTDGTCNAFYNGSSINFYTTAGGCNALSLIGDVMYHEYGHGISRVFYNSQGSSFDNGAQGEGYSDIWACGITHSPLIGPGFYIGQPLSTIRRYDINPKVYPQDIVGQVHADGEIIAGAWWDTGVNWGDVDSMASLFASTYYGLATGPNGTEGQVYFDILIDALEYDDDNNNLSDGTPHFNAIVPAFAAHGIYLLSNTTLTHTSPFSVIAGTPITISATPVSDFPGFIGDVKMIYRLKGTTVSDTITMTKVGANYIGQITGSSLGDVYEYIFVVYDNTNYLSLFSPSKAAFSNGFTSRNIPYYVMVGYNTVLSEPFDTITTTTPNWTIGNAPTDNATGGKWIVASPISSAINGQMVQTGNDHTTGSGKCAVTGNALSSSSSSGNADVDGGRTSLITENYNLATYNKPVISYWRWFSNSQGDTDPGKDVWRVWISYDNGVNWKMVERTKIPDVRWRQNVIVPDLSFGATAKLMFIATDTVYSGVTGTLVEAAVDDIEILELGNGSSVGTQNIHSLNASIYPNPTSLQVNIVIPESGLLNYSIVNTLGEVVLQNNQYYLMNNLVPINTSGLSNGIYFIKLFINDKQTTHRLLIAR